MPNDSESARVRRARLLLADFEKALLRLGEALAQPENEFIRDAAIQRFEFSVVSQPELRHYRVLL